MQISSEDLALILPKEHFERTETTVNDGRQHLLVARLHFQSALAIQNSDLAGSYQLLYDAARKTLQAILMGNGLRISASGGHFAFVRLAESSIFSHPAWLEFRTMRMIRNHLEYPHREEWNLSI